MVNCIVALIILAVIGYLLWRQHLMSESIYDMNLRLDKVIVEKRIANMARIHDPDPGGGHVTRMAKGEVQRGAPDRRRLHDIGMEWTEAVKDVADITAALSGEEALLDKGESREDTSETSEEQIPRLEDDYEEERAPNRPPPPGGMKSYEQGKVSISDNDYNPRTFVPMEDVQIGIVNVMTLDSPLKKKEPLEVEEITEVEDSTELQEPKENSVASDDDDEGLPPSYDDVETVSKDSNTELPDTNLTHTTRAGNKRNRKKRP